MKTIMRSFLLLVIAGIGLSLTVYHARAQMTAEVLPVNATVTVNAPREPVNRKTVFKKVLRYCSFESQNVPDYVKVFRFPVTPGQKYTLYDCHPAPSAAARINIYLSGDTPLTNETFSYGPSGGFTRGFVSRAQQPWPMARGEQASCDLFRHNITIAPQSEHNNLYVIVNFNKPDLSTKIMLKHPADSDDAVVRSTNRSRGTVWSAPFLLTNIPDRAAGAAKPPATGTQPPGSAGGQVSGTSPTQGSAAQVPGTTPGPPKPDTPSAPRSGVVKEAPATSGNATVIPYNSTVRAYINRSDYDTFRFDFPGGRMRVASRGGLDIVADLWDAKGNRIARDGQDAKKDFVIEANLPPGTYYIQVRFMYHAGEGPYTLILGDGSGPVLTEANQ